MAAGAAPPISLNVRRTLSAPPERVFQAWTKPEEVRKWWGPDGFTAPEVELDVRVGGRFRIAMQPPQGDVIWLSGEYREVSPPHRLVFTWQWEGDPVITLVTLDFLNRDGMTELRLTHERFPNQDTCQRHEEGWSSMLDRLPAVV